ncbi:hypothetical protein J6590_043786 [Homalodisca vitripennis]|nr:hypothetical protein J6590_043786 [Homalodisca vitripennis]
MLMYPCRTPPHTYYCAVAMGSFVPCRAGTGPTPGPSPPCAAILDTLHRAVTRRDVFITGQRVQKAARLLGSDRSRAAESGSDTARVRILLSARVRGQRSGCPASGPGYSVDNWFVDSGPTNGLGSLSRQVKLQLKCKLPGVSVRVAVHTESGQDVWDVAMAGCLFFVPLTGGNSEHNCTTPPHRVAPGNCFINLPLLTTHPYNTIQSGKYWIEI